MTEIKFSDEPPATVHQRATISTVDVTPLTARLRAADISERLPPPSSGEWVLEREELRYDEPSFVAAPGEMLPPWLCERHYVVVPKAHQPDTHQYRVFEQGQEIEVNP